MEHSERISKMIMKKQTFAIGRKWVSDEHEEGLQIISMVQVHASLWRLKWQRFINGKYQVLHRIDSHPYLETYIVILCSTTQTQQRLLRVEANKNEDKMFSTELAVLNALHRRHGGRNLAQVDGFPKLYEFGQSEQTFYAITHQDGPSLSELLQLCGGKFSLSTTLMITLQILDRLQELHSKSYLLKEMTPEAFTVGLGSESHMIKVHSLTKCCRFRSNSKEHAPYRRNVPLTVDPVFASSNVHLGISASRRDDMESLLYLMTYLHRGCLPWSNLKMKSSKDIQIAQVHQKVSPEALMSGLPDTLIDLMWYTQCIDYFEVPDYNFFRKILSESLLECLKNQKQPATFDWNRCEDAQLVAYEASPHFTRQSRPIYNRDQSNQVSIKSSSQVNQVEKNQDSQ